jgi:ABC-type transport system involved in multi-copper enzyme maturation permease subunit
MMTVMQRDFRELRKTNAFRIMLIISAAIVVAASTGISILLRRQAWLGTEEGQPWLELIISLIVYFLPVLIMMAFIWAFASLSVTREKVNGNVECLLATPLKPVELWMGKSLSIFLPALVITIAATILVVLTINLAAILPVAGEFALPSAAIAAGLVANLLLFFGLLSFIILFSLANNPDIAIAPSFIIGFGLMVGIPLGLATGTVNPAAWSFVLWYFMGTALAWIGIGYLLRLLKKENIVLSSKGE